MSPIRPIKLFPYWSHEAHKTPRVHLRASGLVSRHTSLHHPRRNIQFELGFRFQSNSLGFHGAHLSPNPSLLLSSIKLLPFSVTFYGQFELALRSIHCPKGAGENDLRDEVFDGALNGFFGFWV